ncbi:DUF4870 domain-containing protein [Cellulomonas fimi]|uniref:DUF4870 domain-containing protein n=1 Tax=Cellulomonas fimi TaxID=1708 RepID=A0A7Y0QFR4_CELFI|nr:DUF4870 domain-containing protein [Cellulomonas fimi]NMR19321.1 DUF4870 domain-containing protein [Cellulomonas fimi]
MRRRWAGLAHLGGILGLPNFTLVLLIGYIGPHVLGRVVPFVELLVPVHVGADQVTTTPPEGSPDDRPADSPEPAPGSGATPPPPPSAQSYGGSTPPPPPTHDYGAPQGAYPPPPSQGAYPPPAQGAYPPPGQGAYPPPQGAYPPPAYGVGAPLSDSDQRMWSLLSHLGTLLVGFIAPLIVWLVFRERGAFVEDQSKESLNFQITMTIVGIVIGIVSVITLGIGTVLYFPFGVLVLIFVIIAAVRSSSGERYRYPLTYRFIK